MIRVAAHIRFDHLCKHTRILDHILLQLPGATYRDFLTKDEPMVSWAGANEQTADDGTSSASLDFTLYLIQRPDGWKVWGSY